MRIKALCFWAIDHLRHLPSPTPYTHLCSRTCVRAHTHTHTLLFHFITPRPIRPTHLVAFLTNRLSEPRTQTYQNTRGLHNLLVGRPDKIQDSEL